jgi:MFS family permease
MISALLTVGPVDTAILTSITALAIALPLNIAGIFVLRLIKDINDVGLDDLVLRSFKAAGFPKIDAYFPPAAIRTSMHQRGATLALSWSLGILTFSVALTLTGLVAAVWHMRWWIGVILMAVVLLSTALVVVVIAHALPPETDAEKELKKRYAESRRLLT